MRNTLLSVVAAGVLCCSGTQAQPTEPFVVDSLVNAFSLYGQGHNPFVYTPTENGGYYTLIKRGGVVGSNTEGSNNLFVISSDNDGQNWTAPMGSLTDLTEYPAPRYPGVFVLANAETELQDIGYVFHFPYHSGMGDAPWLGQVFGQANTQYTGSEQWFTATVERPIVEGKEMFLGTYSELVASPDGSKTLLVGDFIVNDGELPEEANMIGAARFDVTQDEFPNVFLPWSKDEFNVDNSTFAETNLLLGLGLDEQETAYVMLSARLASREENMPAAYTSFNGPIVATTSDYGATWSDWIPMPVQVFSQYLETHSPTAGTWSEANSGFIYNQAEMVVVGPDHLVAFCAVLLASEDMSELEVHFVEVEYSAGQWNMRQVVREDYSPRLLNTQGSLEYEDSQKLNELEIAVTTNREYVVAKWVGFDNNPEYSSDVYLSYRKLGEEQWSTPTNSTQSEFIVKCTYMPEVVPSVTSIPLIRSVARIESGDVNSNEAQAAIWDPQYIVMWFGDATGGASTVETANSNLDFVVSPHPILEDATVSFELSESLDGEIGIWSVEGHLIQTIHRGYIAGGSNTWQVNVNALSSGTYILAIKSETKNYSTTFVVSK